MSDPGLLYTILLVVAVAVLAALFEQKWLRKRRGDQDYDEPGRWSN